MTGPLNPRRYDLGELRDAARDPSDRPGADGTTPERPDGEASADGERGDQSVPVEPTAPRAAEDPPREGDAGLAGGIDRRAGRADGPTPRGAPASGGVEPSAQSAPQHRGGDERRGEAVDPGRGTEPTASHDPEAADEVESYLRSRHRRRDAGEGERRSRSGGERADAERGRQRPPAHAGSSGAGPSNAAAVLAERSGPDVSKPYLDRLPDAYTAQLEVFEWLEALLTAAGRDATVAALEYYESIGWLSERSREELEDVVSGLSVPGAEAAAPSLGVDDHRESLLYIARLADRRSD